MPSFLYAGGQGDRTGTITITSNAVLGAGALSNLVDGAYGSNASDALWLVNGQTGRYFIFDFGAAKKSVAKMVITFVTAGVNRGSGTWAVSGSNDGVSWLKLSNDFSLSIISSDDNTIAIDTTISNNGYYRYFKLEQNAGGTTGSSPWWTEVYFLLDDEAGDSQEEYYGYPGAFNRINYVTVEGVAPPGGLIGGTASGLINGTPANAAWLLNGKTNGRLTFTFPEPVVLTECRWQQDISAAQGNWKWQGSSDGVVWNDIGAPFTLGGIDQIQTELSGNVIAYTKYSLLQVGGVTTSSAFVREISFKVYAPATVDIVKDLELNWSIESFVVSRSLDLSWSIDIRKSFGLAWSILSSPREDWFAGRWIYGASFPGRITHVVNVEHVTATSYPTYGFHGKVAPVPIPTPVGPDTTAANLNYFYGDYYFRIWADPRLMRLTNPRIGSPLYFGLWNAYPDANVLSSVTLTNLPGVDLLFATPIEFAGYEYQRLAFEITENAPVRLDGGLHFEFAYGEAVIKLEAIVVDALRHIPNWTISETWKWATTVNVSQTGKEQRISNRLAPRYALTLDIQLPDDMDRRLQYRQLWSFISRTLRVPQWQYMAPILASSSAGSNRVYFNPMATDLRIGEYAALIRPANRDLMLVRIEAIEADGATLAVSLDTGVDTGWFMIPTIAMRMPDGTSISMRAVEGTASVNFESVQLRDMETLDSIVLPTFEGVVLLDQQPIVQTDENENFSQNTEVLDNTSSVPQITTFWTSPKVDIRRSWLIDDRATDIHYWRKFCKYANGMQKAFYMPTWRHDLELLETPVLGALQIKVTDPDYAFQWENETYKRIQLRTRNGPVYRRIIDIDDLGSNEYALTLSATLGTNEGDNEISMVSFLNLVRQDSDDVSLTHDENYSIITLSLITVNA